MRQSLTAILIALVLAAPTSAQDAPTIDHHQHLYSPGIVALIAPQARTRTSVRGAERYVTPQHRLGPDS